MGWVEQELLLKEKSLEAPSLGDYARNVGASFFDLAGAAPSFGAYIADQVFDNRALAIDLEYGANSMFDVGTDIRSLNTEAGQRVAAAAFGSEDFWNHPFAWTGLQGANTAAPIIAGVAGAIVSGPTTALLLNSGIAGVHSAGMTYNDMVKDLDSQDLRGNRLYESYLAQGMSSQEARREFKKQAIAWKPAALFAVTALLARYSAGGQLASKLNPTAAAAAARAATPKGIVRRVGEAVGMGAGEEGTQNTLEEFMSQSVRVDTGLQAQYDDIKLAEAFASGAVVGGALGAIAGVPRGTPRPAAPPAPPPPPVRGALDIEAPPATPAGDTTSRPAPPPGGAPPPVYDPLADVTGEPMDRGDLPAADIVEALRRSTSSAAKDTATDFVDATSAEANAAAAAAPSPAAAAPAATTTASGLDPEFIREVSDQLAEINDTLGMVPPEQVPQLAVQLINELGLQRGENVAGALQTWVAQEAEKAQATGAIDTEGLTSEKLTETAPGVAATDPLVQAQAQGVAPEAIITPAPGAMPADDPRYSWNRKAAAVRYKGEVFSAKEHTEALELLADKVGGMDAIDESQFETGYINNADEFVSYEDPMENEELLPRKAPAVETPAAPGPFTPEERNMVQEHMRANGTLLNTPEIKALPGMEDDAKRRAIRNAMVDDGTLVKLDSGDFVFTDEQVSPPAPVKRPVGRPSNAAKRAAEAVVAEEKKNAPPPENIQKDFEIFKAGLRADNEAKKSTPGYEVKDEAEIHRLATMMIKERYGPKTDMGSYAEQTEETEARKLSVPEGAVAVKAVSHRRSAGSKAAQAVGPSVAKPDAAPATGERKKGTISLKPKEETPAKPSRRGRAKPAAEMRKRGGPDFVVPTVPKTEKYAPSDVEPGKRDMEGSGFRVPTVKPEAAKPPPPAGPGAVRLALRRLRHRLERAAAIRRTNFNYEWDQRAQAVDDDVKGAWEAHVAARKDATKTFNDETEAGIQAALAAHEAELVSPPQRPRVVLEDISPEGVARRKASRVKHVLVEQPGMLGRWIEITNARRDAARELEREARIARGDPVPPRNQPKSTNPKFEAEKAAQQAAAGEILDNTQSLPMPASLKDKGWLDRLRDHLQQIITAADASEKANGVKLRGSKTERKGPDVSWIIEARRLAEALRPGNPVSWTFIGEFLSGEATIKAERLQQADDPNFVRTDPFLDMARINAGKHGADILDDEGNVIGLEGIDVGTQEPTYKADTEDQVPASTREIINVIADIMDDIKRLTLPHTSTIDSWLRDVVNPQGRNLTSVERFWARNAATKLAHDLAVRVHQDQVRKGTLPDKRSPLTPAERAEVNRQAVRDFRADNEALIAEAQAAIESGNAQRMRDALKSETEAATAKAEIEAERARKKTPEGRAEAEARATAAAEQAAARTAARKSPEGRAATLERTLTGPQRVQRVRDTRRQARADRARMQAEARDAARRKVEQGPYTKERMEQWRKAKAEAVAEEPAASSPDTVEGRQQSRNEALEAAQMNDVWAIWREGPKRPTGQFRELNRIFQEQAVANAAYEAARKLRRKLAETAPADAALEAAMNESAPVIAGKAVPVRAGEEDTQAELPGVEQARSRARRDELEVDLDVEALDELATEDLGRAKSASEFQANLRKVKREVKQRSDAAKRSTNPLEGPYQKEGEPDVYVKPQRTITVTQMLAELDWDRGFKGLRGKFHKSAMMFLRKRLLATVGDMPVHILSQFDVQTYLNQHGTKPTWGAYIEDKTNPSEDLIILSADLFRASSSDVIRTVLHEVVHAAVNRGVGRDKKLQQALSDLMSVVMKFHGIVDAKVHYGFKDIFEFVAEAMTNERFQKLLVDTPLSKEMSARFKAPNAFKAFVEWIRQALGTPKETLSALEALVSVTEEFTTEPTTTVRHDKRGGSKKPPAEKRMREYADEVRVDFSERVFGTGLEPRMRPPIWVAMRGLDQLVRDAKRFFGGDENAVRRIEEALTAISEDTHDNMLASEELMQELHAVQRAVGPEVWRRFARFAIDVSNANLNVRIPLADNKHLGVDPVGKPGLKAAQARTKHYNLSKEYNELTRAYPALKPLYDNIQTYTRKRHADMARELISNKLHEGMRGSDGVVPPEVDDAMVERILTRKLTDADEKFIPKSLLKTIYSAKEIYGIGGDYVPQIRRGNYVVSGRVKFDTPDPATGAKLMDGTDASGEPIDNIFEFRGADARKNAMEYADSYEGSAWVTGVTIDEKTGESWEEVEGEEVPGSRHRVVMTDPDAIRVYRVEIQNKYVEFFDTEREARRHAFELQSDPDFVSTKPAQARRFGPGDRGVEFQSSDIQQLHRALTRRTEFKNMTPAMQNELSRAVSEFGLQMMGSTRVHKRRMPLRKVLGPSLDLTRNIHDYARSTSSYLARLQNARDLNDAVLALEKQTNDPTLPRETLAGRRVIANEVMKRIESGNGFTVGNKWWSPFLQRLLTTSFISRLASPMYTIMNMMQVPMVAYPALAARYGHAAAFRALTQAARDLGAGKVLKKGLKETGRKIGAPRSATETYIDDLKSRLKTDDEKALMDLIQQRGTLEIDKLQKAVRPDAGLMGKAGQGLDTFLSYTESIARQMPIAAEMVNRSTVLLATYRLELAKNGGNVRAATNHAKDTNNSVNFNYSEVNTPQWANTPLGKIAFQFKRFGHGMYQFIGQQIGRAIRNDEPGDRAEALKSLAYLAATHTLMAGTLGLPTEPIKGLVVGLFAVGVTGFNWQDVEDWERRLAADALGKDLGEGLTRGVTRLLPLGLAFDMSSRVGLADMFLAREPNTGDPETFKSWMQDMAFGAPGAMVFDWAAGVRNFAEGDYAAGLQKTLPVKGLRDLVKAIDVGYRGKLTPSGRPSFDPYTWSEAFLQVLGATPGRAAESQEFKASFYSNQAYYSAQRSDIMQRWADASPAERIRMRGEIERYNRNKPDEADLKTKELVTYTKRRASEIAKTSPGGVVANRTTRYLAEDNERVYNVGQ